MTTVEGASQEYLKNVVLNYMLSTDMASKNHMLKAIAAVLRLTPKEIKRVIDHNAAWWWNQSKVPSSSPSASRSGRIVNSQKQRIQLGQGHLSNPFPGK